VRPGDVVVLETGQDTKGSPESASRARVKSIQKLNKPNELAFHVGVELETAGNIWGIASPPADWLPEQTARMIESPVHGREIRLVARTEPQKSSARSDSAFPAPLFKKGEAAAALSPWFSELMGALSNQIQGTVSEIAALTLATEKNRLLDEFRLQLQDEAASAIEHVIATSKDELVRRALKLLNENAESTVRSSHANLVGAIGRDMEQATQRMTTQENELSQRIASMAAATVERMQRSLEASRAEAGERFVSRLREQVAPVVEEARADLQKLAATQTVLKEESQAIHKRVKHQLESDANAKVQQAQEELDKNSAAILNECNEKLRELSQIFEKIARDSAQSMIASATDDAKKNLEDRAGELSNYFTGQLEGHIRNYLEFIGESIAEFPKKTPAS